MIETPTEPILLCDRCSRDHPGYMGGLASHSVCRLCSGLAVAVHGPDSFRPWTPNRYGAIPNSSTSLVPIYRIVWDVNGYYRSLGVGTDATRRQIRQAYQDAEGHEDPRLTYIVSQLIDPETRRKYDACQPGTIFFDRYIEEEFNRRVAERNSDLARLGDELLEGSSIDLGDLRNLPVSVLDGGADNLDTSHPGSATPWRYYIWQVDGGKARDPNKLQILRDWQHQLCVAIAPRSVRFAVGLASESLWDSWSVQVVDHLPVVFIRDGETPSPELAMKAARDISRHTHH